MTAVPRNMFRGKAHGTFPLPHSWRERECAMSLALNMSLDTTVMSTPPQVADNMHTSQPWPCQPPASLCSITGPAPLTGPRGLQKARVHWTRLACLNPLGPVKGSGPGMHAHETQAVSSWAGQGSHVLIGTHTCPLPLCSSAPSLPLHAACCPAGPTASPRAQLAGQLPSSCWRSQHRAPPTLARVALGPSSTGGCLRPTSPCQPSLPLPCLLVEGRDAAWGCRGTCSTGLA